jgi:hypothetical protein
MKLRELQSTAVAGVVAGAIILTAALTNVDLVRLNLKLLEGIQKNEVDDVLAGLVLVFLALMFDVWRRGRRRAAEIEAQKVQTLKATMRTVHDIVNNLLNGLMLFQMEAVRVMPRGSLDPLEELVQQTFEKLKALGDLEVVQERRLGTGMGINFEDASRR